MAQARDRAVVQVRGTGPDAVERAGDVTLMGRQGSVVDDVLGRQAGRLVGRAVCCRRRVVWRDRRPEVAQEQIHPLHAQNAGPVRVGADILRSVDDPVSGAVTARAVLAEERVAAACPHHVDGEFVRGRR